MLANAIDTSSETPLTLGSNAIQRRPTHRTGDSELHHQLAIYAKQRLVPGCPDADWNTELLMRDRYGRLEATFLEEERAKVASWAKQAPTDPTAFVTWFQRLRQEGPGQFDPFFDWLAHAANYEQMRWFIRQEVVGEAGFDDLIALAQLRMPTLAKLEMARNYWDEMGRGRENAMHGPILEVLARDLEVDDESIGEVIWETLALGNVFVGLAANRRFAYHAVGALGAVELTAPTRTAKVDEALERLGVEPKSRLYYRMHTTVDVVHSKDWNEQVLFNLVAEDASRARWIAEGALMRLNAGARCFDRYRAHFGLDGPRAAIG